MKRDGQYNNGNHVGWFCAYTPIEAIIAAGLKPVRLFGVDSGSEMADNLMGQNICPYARSCLAQGLNGEAPGAVVFAGCCDSMRRLRDAWSYYCDCEFSGMIDVPRGNGSASLAIYKNSLRKLLNGLQKYTGTKITADDLWEAIKKRMEVEEILESRITPEYFKGSLRHSLFLESQQEDPETFVRKYGEDTVRSRQDGSRTNHINIAITGNFLGSERLIEAVEDCGGTVSVLDLCSVERFLTWRDVPEEKLLNNNDLEAVLDFIAETYISRTPCPRTLDRQARLDTFVELIDSGNCSGIIYVPLMFCDPFLYELPELKKISDERGIPGLLLQSDYRDDNMGQIRTRIEAFMEML